jgi:hypothetical protein
MYMMKREFNQNERERLASSGAALSDGSYPIVNRGDLENAIQAYGRASNKGEVKDHIMRRARALGLEELLPEAWKNPNAMKNVWNGVVVPKPIQK